MLSIRTRIRRTAAVSLAAAAALGGLVAATAAPASAATPGSAQAWHYEVHYVNNTGHTLQLTALSKGTNESWNTQPPSTVASGATGTFEIGSSYFYAEGTVAYQDVATNATVTFSGHADSLIHDSHTFANTTGGMSVSGKQGYYGGITPHINVTYTLS